MQNDLVSVVMPAYNAEKYIAFAVDSVLNQTYGNTELIVVNDCSEDRTAEIISGFMEKDSRVRLITLSGNKGVAEARNRGITEARGKWIAFLDSDDAWDREKLDKQLLLAERKNADFLFTGSAFMDERGAPLKSFLNVPEETGYRELLKQNIISCSSVLIKRDLILNYPMDAGKNMHEDFAVWLQILKTGKKAYGVNEPLLIYRMYKTSKSGNKRKAAGMTFRVYRYLRLNIFQSVYYWLIYSFRSFRKYRKIRGA